MELVAILFQEIVDEPYTAMVCHDQVMYYSSSPLELMHKVIKRIKTNPFRWFGWKDDSIEDNLSFHLDNNKNEWHLKVNYYDNTYVYFTQEIKMKKL